MMNSSGAQIGDRVQFWQDDTSRLEGIVQWRPQAEGDSWVLHEDDGTIWHVQKFETMRVLSRKAQGLQGKERSEDDQER